MSICIPHVIESIFIEVQNNRSKPFIVGIIYRPNTFPLADLDRFISELLEVQSKIASENKIAYLMGDYNINLLKFNTHQKTNDFIDNVISQGFIPHITKPTRVTTDSATLIGHIYSNRTYSNHSSGIIITDIADHFGTFHITHEATQKHKPIFLPKRQLRDDNLLAFGRLLITTDLSPVIQALDPDEAYNIFIGIYTLAFDKACPIKYTRIKSKFIKREPWITQGLLTSIIHKSKLFRNKMTKPTEHNINYYRIYCNIFNKLKRLAKAHYYSDMLHMYRNNIKKTWIILREALCKHKMHASLPRSFCMNRKDISNPKHIAEEFNNFFAEIGTKLSNSIPQANLLFSNYLTENYPNNSFLLPTDPVEIIQITNSQENKKAPVTTVCQRISLRIQSRKLLCLLPIFLTNPLLLV